MSEVHRNLPPCVVFLLFAFTCFCHIWISEATETSLPVVLSYCLYVHVSVICGCLNCKVTCLPVVFSYCLNVFFSVRFGCLKCSETSFIILFAYCLNVHVPVTLGCVKCKEALISSFDFARNPLAMQSKFSKQLQTTACNCANGGRQPSNQANKLNKVTVNTIGFYSREGVYQ